MMEVLGFLLSLVVFVFVVWGMFLSIGSKGKRKELNNEILDKLEAETSGGFLFSTIQRYLRFGDLGGHYIGFLKIDSESNLIQVFSVDLPDLLENYDLSSVEPFIIHFDELEEVEVISDGNTLTKTNRGSQAAGAALGTALLGPAGLLVGGLSGSTSAKEKVEQVKIRIRVQNAEKPLHEIVAFNSELKGGMKANSSIVKSALQPVDELVARLKNIIAKNSRDLTPLARSVTEKGSIANELSELHDLLRAGVISKEEFGKLKLKVIEKSA